jgi:hypothetical protein
MFLNLLNLLAKLFEGHRLIEESKKKGLLFYLRVLQGVRTSIIGIVALVFAFQLCVLSFVGLVLTGLYLAPIETEAKIWILLVGCTSIVLAVSAILVYALSEKTWLKHSGVKDLIGKS